MVGNEESGRDKHSGVNGGGMDALDGSLHSAVLINVIEYRVPRPLTHSPTHSLTLDDDEDARN